MLHPYLKRRQGLEEPVCLHPSLEPVLKRTLGVPLFQEQLLRMAMIAAGFSGGEAEELRRAFGFKCSEKRMHEVEIKLRQGMDRTGITGETQERLVQAITSFAPYGFPESHAASFALIAYASAYLKRTAKRFVFLSLEDETGIINVIVEPALFERRRPICTAAPYLLIKSVLQSISRVVSVKAGEIGYLRLPHAAVLPSHDFH